MSASTRPTKRQHELLSFIEDFITEHGYSPTYREIMRGCNYSSVATVALHIKNLIARGHVRKRDKSARSLEVVKGDDVSTVGTGEAKHQHIVEAIEQRLKHLEKEFTQTVLDEVYVLVGALKVLGHHNEADGFMGYIAAHEQV